MAGRTNGPEAEYVKAPLSTGIGSRAEIVEPPRQTIPHTPANETAQTIHSSECMVGEKHPVVVRQGGVA